MSKQEDLKNAREMLKGWMLAEQAVMTGQEYRMGTRFLRRADLGMIGDRVKFWQSEIERLEGKSRTRVQQVIPRDM